MILDNEYFDSFEVIKAGFMAIKAVDPTMLKLIVISFAEESESKNQHSKADP